MGLPAYIVKKNMIYNNQNYIIGFVSKIFDLFTIATVFQSYNSLHFLIQAIK